MSKWIKEGKLKYKEFIVPGIENAPKTFLVSSLQFGFTNKMGSSGSGGRSASFSPIPCILVVFL